MQKTQMKYQRPVIVACFVLACVMIVYALGFSTDLYPLIYHTDPGSSLFYVEGAELYLTVQPFNRAFFIHALLHFLVCIALFLTLTHRRRLYYASNYITSAAFAVSSVALGAELFVNVKRFKELYLTIDFEKLREVTGSMRLDYVESTLMMDIGFVLSFVLFVFAAAVCVNLALKTHWMKRERWAVPGEGDAA